LSAAPARSSVGDGGPSRSPLARAAASARRNDEVRPAAGFEGARSGRRRCRVRHPEARWTRAPSRLEAARPMGQSRPSTDGQSRAHYSHLLTNKRTANVPARANVARPARNLAHDRPEPLTDRPRGTRFLAVRAAGGRTPSGGPRCGSGLVQRTPATRRDRRLCEIAVAPWEQRLHARNCRAAVRYDLHR
jgi:hypothetical protein